MSVKEKAEIANDELLLFCYFFLLLKPVSHLIKIIMKTIGKMGLAVVAVLMTCFAFTSCDEGDGLLVYSKDIVGTWVYCQDGTFEVLTISLNN